SSKGVAGCGEILGVGAGFEYNWDTGDADVFGGCDLSGSSVHIATAARASAPDATGLQVRVPAHRPAVSFEATGTRDAPRVTVVDPHGHSYSDNGQPVQRHGPAAVLHVEGAHKTIIIVRGAPPGGNWTVSAEAGSTLITGLSMRVGLPPTRIRAHVHG